MAIMCKEPDRLREYYCRGGAFRGVGDRYMISGVSMN